MTEIPHAVSRLIISVCGMFQVVADHSSSGPGRPRTWEVEDLHGGRWFVKWNPVAKFHRREVTAYTSGWTEALGTNRAPLIAAHDSDANAMVMTTAAGFPVHQLRLGIAEEVEVYRQAGQLLSKLAACPIRGYSSAGNQDSWERSLKQMLASARQYTTREDQELLRELTHEPPAALPLVVSHGDFMPRNWLWDSTERVLRIVDFERTKIRPSATRDLPRLYYRILARRPDLKTAFFDGLGRQMSVSERRACAAYGALDVMSALRFGVEHRNVSAMDEAHTILRNIRAEHVQQFANCGQSEQPRSLADRADDAPTKVTSHGY